VERLDNPIQRYAWGSPTAIPSLLGKAPDGSPQAELWLGAHPSAPSKVGGVSLEALIAQAPGRLLGEASIAHFGPRLPFLLKVLAAAQPLSLQAHPSLAQARAGFADENARGVPLSAAHRNYKDPNHKPEILCALTTFHALCGFRRLDDTARLFDALGLDTARLRGGLRGYFEWVMTLPAEERVALVKQVERACATAPAGWEHECGWALRLCRAYPGDVGVVGALLLNLVTLEPGQAIYLPAGNLHAYLEGVGVELMANSDNVLRGGLTPKHVDVPELLRVLDFTNGPVTVLAPQGAVAVYSTPAPDFELSRLTVAGPVEVTRRGPELLLVTGGPVRVNGHALSRGQSCFLGANDSGAVRFEGDGVVFRATAGVEA
jgi:mannose-6-phosphate isomerase